MPYNERYMKLAIKEACKNFQTLEGGPFGACIVKDGEVLAVARNTVLKHDATCHAEINAIRKASKKLGTHDLSGTTIYSTTEPCTMCFSAVHWARIDRIYFGTSIKDALKAGFNELSISNVRMKSLGNSPVEIVPHFLKDDCRILFDRWNEMEDTLLY